MKTKIQFLAAFFILFNISSCGDDLAELEESFLNIDVNTNLKEDFNIHVEAGTNESFNNQEVVNINNEDTQKYLKNIKDVQITKLTFKLKNFTGNDATGVIAGDFFADGSLLYSKSIIVKEACDNEIVFEITNLEEINKIADKFENGQNVTISYRGTSNSNSAMNFDVEISFSVIITVKP